MPSRAAVCRQNHLTPKEKSPAPAGKGKDAETSRPHGDRRGHRLNRRRGKGAGIGLPWQSQAGGGAALKEVKTRPGKLKFPRGSSMIFVLERDLAIGRQQFLTPRRTADTVIIQPVNSNQ